MKRDRFSWQEAQTRCRLSDEEVAMAKELGFQPSALIKNIPSNPQRWKAPVGDWIRSLHTRKIRRLPAPPESAAGLPASRIPSQPVRIIEFRNPDDPWPDRPDIPEPFYPCSEPPSDNDIQDCAEQQIRRQRLFRWAAQSIARAMSAEPEVRKVAAFGAASQPLKMEVPRFVEFRRYGIQIPHECGDLDLAVWIEDFGQLTFLKLSLQQGLQTVQYTLYGGVAHHEVNVHLFDAVSGAYHGSLCHFGECPKTGKQECLVPQCGDRPFLRQLAEYNFNRQQFESEPQVLLFDRESGFLVRPPRIESPMPDEDESDDDVPF